MAAADQMKSLVWFNLDGFLLGLAGTWLYAAIRPRYGAGAGTAVKAGLGLWVLGWLSYALLSQGMAIFTQRLVVIPLCGGIVIAIVSMLIGGALYKEA